MNRLQKRFFGVTRVGRQTVTVTVEVTVTVPHGIRDVEYFGCLCRREQRLSRAFEANADGVPMDGVANKREWDAVPERMATWTLPVPRNRL